MYNLETIMEELIEQSITYSAYRYKKKREFDISKKLYLKALKLQKKLLLNDKNHYGMLILSTLHSLATLYREENNSLMAIKYYKQSIFILKKMFPESIEHQYSLARKYMNIADLYRRNSNYEESEYFYNRALEVYMSLPQNEIDKSKLKLMNLFNSLSIVCNEQNKLEETKESYMGLLNIYQILIRDDSEDYQHELAMTLYDLASLYFKHNRQNRAGEVYLLALEILLSLNQKKPNFYNETLASVFYRLADIYTTQHEYKDAVSAYRASLNYYVELAEEEPSKYAFFIVSIFEDLAGLYRTQERMDMAEEFHLKVVNLYSELFHYNEDKYTLKLASSLIEGVLYYHQHPITLYQAEAVIQSYSDSDNDIEVEGMLKQIHSIRSQSKSTQ